MSTRTNIAGTTLAEAEVLDATAAAIAAGADPFGDEVDTAGAGEDAAAGTDADDETDDAGTAAADTKGDPADGDGDQAATLPLEAETVVAAAEDPAPAPAAAPRYNAGDPADFKTQRTELTTEKAKALKDLMEGVIEPDAYSAIVDAVDDKLDALTVRRTLHEANVQTEQQTQGNALDSLMAAAKKAGEVDYGADPKAAKQFDAAMAMLAEPGDTRSYAEQVAEAHKAVLAIRGVKPAAAQAAAAAPALAATPRENGKGPMTLRNVPAAATPNTGGGWQEQLASLSGQDYEAAFARLTPAQQVQMRGD